MSLYATAAKQKKMRQNLLIIVANFINLCRVALYVAIRVTGVKSDISVGYIIFSLAHARRCVSSSMCA